MWWIGLLLIGGMPFAAGSMEDLEEEVRRQDADTEVRWRATYRARLSYPQTLSAGVGLLRTRMPHSWECLTPCPYNGLFLQVEPGVNGVQLAAGYATLKGQQRNSEHWITDPLVGFATKGVLLRTWGDATLNPSNRDYAGIEFAYSIVRFNFSVGALRAIDGHDGDEWLTTFGFGWGF